MKKIIIYILISIFTLYSYSQDNYFQDYSIQQNTQTINTQNNNIFYYNSYSLYEGFGINYFNTFNNPYFYEFGISMNSNLCETLNYNENILLYFDVNLDFIKAKSSENTINKFGLYYGTKIDLYYKYFKGLYIGGGASLKFGTISYEDLCVDVPLNIETGIIIKDHIKLFATYNKGMLAQEFINENGLNKYITYNYKRDYFEIGISFINILQ